MSQISTTSTGSDITDRYAAADRFVAAVHKACREPGTRAALRRGLRRPPEQAYRSHAVVGRLISPDLSRAEEWAYYAVASFIAAQPPAARRIDQTAVSAGPDLDERAAARATPGAAPDMPTGLPGGQRRSNLGTSMALAVARDSTGRRALAEDSAEKRLHLLTRQELAGLHRHLPATIAHLRTTGVSVDWAVLITDLAQWPRNRGRVAKRWLQAFYRRLPIPSEDSPTARSDQP